MPALADVDLPAPFRVEGEHLAIDLAGAGVLFTTRRGGVSRGPWAALNLGPSTGDDPAAVATNRECLAARLGLPWGRVAHGRQVHGARVRRVREAPRPDDAAPPCDGQATDVPGVAALVVVADCLPVALAAPGAVAMLHCGWRGLAAGIVGEGVAALRELAGAEAPVGAAIGPGIGPCCYEVGEEVHAAFAHHGAAVRRGRHLDTPAVARRELEAAGVGSVHETGLCTACHPELLFSHRRDRGVTGRQAGVAWLRG